MSESRTITVSENGVDHNIAAFKTAVFFLDVTAVPSPYTDETFDMVITEKDPESGKYFVIASFTQVTNAAASERLTVNPLFGSIIRYEATLAGTAPSYTFQLTAELKD